MEDVMKKKNPEVARPENSPEQPGAGAPEAVRGRPGRRTADERTRAVLQLLEGKASVDQIAQRFGVRSETVEKWRRDAVEAVTSAMRQGTTESPQERELEKKLKTLEQAFTDLAIRHELVQRALSERPTRPGRWSR
jgi:transposase-like protein